MRVCAYHYINQLLFVWSQSMKKRCYAKWLAYLSTYRRSFFLRRSCFCPTYETNRLVSIFFLASETLKSLPTARFVVLKLGPLCKLSTGLGNINKSASFSFQNHTLLLPHFFNLSFMFHTL